MRKIKLKSSLLSVILGSALLVSACNGPNQDLKIESLGSGTYPTTGAFQQDFSLPAVLPAKSMLYVQNGRVFQSLSSVDPRQPQCLLEVNRFQVSFPEILATYQVSKLPLERVKSFFKQAGLVRVELVKRQGKFGIRISDQISSETLAPKAPYVLFQVKLDANLSCGRTGSGIHTDRGLTVGELMKIFRFEYIFEAPSV